MADGKLEQRTAVLTLDLEADYAGLVEPQQFAAFEAVERLAQLLTERNLPLSVFAQTSVLEDQPDVVEKLRPVADDFHAHSHRHPLRHRSVPEDEIRGAAEAFRAFFGRRPLGYRFPLGDVRTEDYALLERHGYRFDASVFPSWRPGHFSNLRAPRVPYYPTESDVLEIPFSTLGATLRVPHSLSYLKLLGRPYLATMGLAAPPEIVVFGFHLVDLLTPPSYATLPRRHRLIYRRNGQRGFALLDAFVRRLEAQGFGFTTMTELYRKHTVPRGKRSVVQRAPARRAVARGS